MGPNELELIYHQVETAAVNFPQSSVQWSAAGNKKSAQLVWLASGSAALCLRQDSISVSGPRLLWVPIGMLNYIRFSSGSHAIVVGVSHDMLLHLMNSIGHSEVPYRILVESLCNFALSAEQMAESEHCIVQIQNELVYNRPGIRAVIYAQLVTLLTYLYRQEDCMTLIDDTHSFGSTISHRFLQLVELHFHEHWRIVDYAEHLGVTKRRLELALQRDFNAAPSALVHRKLINEALQKLEHSAMSVSEIAYELGYRDPSYFNRFFKRLTNCSPGAWRRLARENEVKRDTSFSAWP